MNEWVDTLLNSDYGTPFVGGTASILFIMLLSFVIGHFIGFVYMWTHEAISYSRTFVASLAVLPVLVAIMMVVMSGSMLVAFGLLAVFGVIRFRNVLKDTRDTTFVLWVIVEGLMVGTMRFSTALVGCVGIAAVFLYLRATSFGTRHRYDAVLTLRLTGDLATSGPLLKELLACHVVQAKLVSERRASEGGVDFAYHLLMRDPARFDDLQTALVGLETATNVSVFLHDDEAEI